MPNLEDLKKKLDKAKVSVKNCKAKFHEAETEEDRAIRRRVLNAARTRRDNARKNYKAAKPKSATRQKMSDASNSVKKTVKKSGFKKVLTWTGLAMTTVVTGFGGYMLYGHLRKNGEGSTSRDTV